MEEKKKVIIIGAGVAGMSAGIYALDNNFDVTIYEKHNIPGGECTGWNRDGVYIDGCAHWIVGTNKNSDLYPLWRHVGAIKENTVVHDTEYFCKFEIGKETVTFYSDPDKLENELLRISPEDKHLIRRFIKGIKTYETVKIPTKKPIDKMNLFELTGYGISLIPMSLKFFFYQRISMEEMASKFKSEILREVFYKILGSEYNYHSFVYVMQALAKHDAGMVEGGSRKIAMDMLKTYIQKGGKIKFSQNVSKILTDKNTAYGIVSNNEEIKADYVISSCDAHHTLYDLLEGKYKDRYLMDKFDNKDYPLQQGFLIAFKIKRNITTYPKMLNFHITPYTIAGFEIKDISIRNHAFDRTINRYETTATVLINVNDNVYAYLKSLSRNDYLLEKEKLGNHILNEVKKRFGFEEDEISLLDVATPLTHERYTNAYHGSYMSFLTTKKARGIMGKGVIKGLKNFVMAGQWIMPPGGLPIALFTGKHAIYRICLFNKQKFYDPDLRYKPTFAEEAKRFILGLLSKKNPEI